jgi:hypothetical protein
MQAADDGLRKVFFQSQNKLHLLVTARRYGPRDRILALTGLIMSCTCLLLVIIAGK